MELLSVAGQHESEKRIFGVNLGQSLIFTIEYTCLAVIANMYDTSSIMLNTMIKHERNTGNIAWRIGSNICLWDGKLMFAIRRDEKLHKHVPSSCVRKK